MSFKMDQANEAIKYLNELQRTKFIINTHKDAWEELSAETLLEGLFKEVIELQEALMSGKRGNAQLECADVANYAVMLCDLIKRKGAQLDVSVISQTIVEVEDGES